MLTRRSLACLALAAAVCLPAAAGAQQAQPVRVRGAIESLDGRVLTVKTREGPSVKITLAENFAVRNVKAVELGTVSTGSYIGTAAMKQADGTYRALEVLVFPEAQRGAGEGIFPWDLQPESTMLNATVGTVAAAALAGARELTISAKGESARVIVPMDVPIVTFEAASRDLLKPGAKVFIGTQRQPDGSYTAAAVTVGKDGVDPPM